MKINRHYFYLFLSFLFQALTVIIGKKASMHLEAFSFSEIVTNPFYIASIICLGMQTIFWQLTLRQLALSFAYFFMSGIYVVILASSYFVYNEPITLNNLLGTVLITVGVVFLVRAKKTV